jgi:hypothetical protein
MAALGIPMDIAKSIAAAHCPEVGRAIQSLYRSARQPAMAEAGRELNKAAARPALTACHRRPRTSRVVAETLVANRIQSATRNGPKNGGNMRNPKLDSADVERIERTAVNV